MNVPLSLANALREMADRNDDDGGALSFGPWTFFHALPFPSWTIQEYYIRFHLKESECGGEEKDQDLV